MVSKSSHLEANRALSEPPPDGGADGLFVQPTRAADIDGPHYSSQEERLADLVVHIVGLAFAIIGGVVAVSIAVHHGVLGLSAAIAIYVLGLTAMLGFSTAYNFAPARWQPFLFRLDHAGIFLMIAASYTPFTTQVLTGAWRLGMTTSIWTLAIVGVLARLFLPRLGEKVSIAFYLAMGWLIVFAIKPLIEHASIAPLVLLAVGGVVYSVGAVLFVQKRLKFRRALWHGHVVAGAVTHYAAVMVGVVLTAA